MKGKPMSRYSSRVSINEIAEEVGVSKATISRYLNGKFEYMSHATREKIKHTIEVMGYRPSKIARSLKLQTSKMIGCIIADISNPASSVIIQGISDVCDAAGYQVLFPTVAKMMPKRSFRASSPCWTAGSMGSSSIPQATTAII